MRDAIYLQCCTRLGRWAAGCCPSLPLVGLMIFQGGNGRNSPCGWRRWRRGCVVQWR